MLPILKALAYVLPDPTMRKVTPALVHVCSILHMTLMTARRSITMRTL